MNTTSPTPAKPIGVESEASAARSLDVDSGNKATGKNPARSITVWVVILLSPDSGRRIRRRLHSRAAGCFDAMAATCGQNRLIDCIFRHSQADLQKSSISF